MRVDGSPIVNWRQHLARGAGLLLDALLPPRCLGCGEVVGGQGELCAPCWSAIRFLHEPWCETCGIPLPHEGLEVMCAACVEAPPILGRIRAALAYDDGSRGMILAFKYRERIDAAPIMARWMVRAGGDLLAEADLIVPVPLHRFRLWRRGFNQASLLAKHIAKAAERPWALNLLQRPRSTGSQQGLNARQRRDNVTSAAFVVPERRRHELSGRRVLLIDDVLTTGSTLEACARVLESAGAAGVDALTVARVVRAG